MNLHGRHHRRSVWDEARGVRCNQTSYYQYDGRGSVTANTWHNGMVTSVYQYDPYGQVELGSTKHTDFYGYNGESYNPNSGLEYLRARHYSASQGRFFQEDTYLGDIADPLTQNRYAYVKNSPMNYVDPSGHMAYAATQQGEADHESTHAMQETTLNGDPLFYTEVGGTSISILMNQASDMSMADLCEIMKTVGSFVAGYYGQYSTEYTLIGRVQKGWLSYLCGSQAMEMVEMELATKYLDGEAYYLGKYIADMIVAYETEWATDAKNFLEYCVESIQNSPWSKNLFLGAAGAAFGAGMGEAAYTGASITGKAGSASVAGVTSIGVAVGVAKVLVVVGGIVVVIEASADLNATSTANAQQNKEKSESFKEGESETKTTNTGKQLDVTPKKNHSTKDTNPGPYGEANSSVDILDENGEVKTRRWYDSEGHAYRDVDMTNHGNPKEHPEWPHEHTWDWSTGKPIRN